MIQFYFLSILLNLAGGFYLFLYNGTQINSSDDEKKETMAFKFFDFLSEKEKLFCIAAGAASVFVGIIKLLSAIQGVAVFGDLIPAVCNIFCGISLLLHYFFKQTSDKNSVPEWMNFIFIESGKYAGLICIVAAVLHFLFPTALFL